MQYSLYTYYSHSSLDLYQIREHFLEHFYLKRNTKDKATKILKAIVGSNKINGLLQESAYKNIAPNYEDFLTTICSMWKFMFRTNETLALATTDAALRWDIEVNSELHLMSPGDLKNEIIKVFDKFSIYEEMTDEEYSSVMTSTVDAEIVEEPKKKPLLEHKKNQTTWTFLAFTEEFGSDVSVGKFHRREDGEPFSSCIFTDDDGYKTFVGFSQKLGVLTADEISLMKDELIIIKSPSGNYNLYKANQNFWKKVKI